VQATKLICYRNGALHELVGLVCWGIGPSTAAARAS